MKNKLIKPRGIKGFILELILIVIIVAAIQHWRTRDTASGTAPALPAAAIGSEPAAAPAGGEAQLVHFWGTWCPVCRLEEGSIDALAQDHRVITVAMASGSDREIEAYLKEHSLSFPVINDDDGQISDQWGVSGVPTSFILNPAGRIVFVTSGYTSGLGLRLRLWLAGR